MSTAQKETIKALSGAISAIALAIVVPLQVWALTRIVAIGESVVSINTWMGEGSRYTETDAAKDFGVVTKVLDAQGKEIDDHEHRIRNLERKGL